MSTRAKVEARAAVLGADVVTLLDGRTPLDVEVRAPDGHVWRGTDVHALIGCRQGGQTKAQVWADLLERMEDGTEECTTPDCDACNE